MSLRYFTLIVILVTFLGLVGIMSFTINKTLLNQFENQERLAMKADLDRLNDALQSKMENLAIIASRWAGSDTTIDLRSPENNDQIQNTFKNSIFEDYQINLITILLPDGEVIFKKFYDLKNHLSLTYPESLPSHFASGEPLVAFSNPASKKQGLLLIPEGPLLVVSLPILSANNAGNFQGILVIGVSVDENFVQKLSISENVTPSLQMINDPRPSPEVIRADQVLLNSSQPPVDDNYIFVANEKTIAGYHLLRDIYGQPALLLRIDEDRPIYINGTNVVNSLTLWLVIAGLTFSIMSILFLEQVVITRLSRLTNEVRQIGESGDSSLRVLTKTALESRGDEIANLAKMINTMLAELDSGKQRLQALSLRLVEVQEEERRRLALELHDEIAQLLTALKIQLKLQDRQLAAQPALQPSTAENLVNELISKVRNLSFDLRPAMLDDLGLLPALIWHFERYTNQTNIQVNFQHSGLSDTAHLPAQVENAAFRIIQEALTNVARYARVTRVNVRLWCNNEALGLQVEDFGHGFDVNEAAAAHSGHGLTGMRERAELVGGVFTLESTLKQGTCLTADIPLKREAVWP